MEPDAYLEGRNAYIAGKTTGVNPYHGELWFCWVDGYNDAKAEAEQEQFEEEQ